MIEIIFATTNLKKLNEVINQLHLDNFLITSLNAAARKNLPGVLENGSTFSENALIKARAYFSYLKRPVFADDSGLVVPALNGNPGIFSARYSGEDATDAKNNALLLENMGHLKDRERDAYFECVIAYKDVNNEKLFRGRLYGSIIYFPRGNNGFGYDPLFQIDGSEQTLAEISTRQKIKISHRAQAVSELGKFLNSLRLNH